MRGSTKTALARTNGKQMKLSEKKYDKKSEQSNSEKTFFESAATPKPKKAHGPFITSVLAHKALTVRCVVYMLLSIISYYFQYAIYISESYAKLRYLRQLFVVISALFLVAFLVALKRLTPRRLILNKLRAFAAATGITAAFESVVKKLHKLFGIPEYERIDGKDAKSFIFRSGERRRRSGARAYADKRKWRDMTTPAEQLRYIYFKFMKARIRDGYVYDPVRTPREHKKLLGDSVVTDDFIHSYCDARYSGGTAAVGDEDVERALPLLSKNGKIS